MNVQSLQEALDVTIQEFGYDRNSRFFQKLIIIILEHINKMDQIPDAATLFTQTSGAREYVYEKGKEVLFLEMKEQVAGENEDIDNAEIIKRYAAWYSELKSNKTRK